jgi:hypothetical protein
VASNAADVALTTPFCVCLTKTTRTKTTTALPVARRVRPLPLVLPLTMTTTPPPPVCCHRQRALSVSYKAVRNNDEDENDLAELASNNTERSTLIDSFILIAIHIF